MTVTGTYAVGSWVAISVPGCWLLVSLPPDHELVRRSWAELSAGSGADDLLDVLTADGIRAAPDFALAECDERSCRVVVRGAAQMVLGDGTIVKAAPNRSWNDVDLDDVELTLAAPETPRGVTLPMAAGVTMASAIQLTAKPDMPQRRPSHVAPTATEQPTDVVQKVPPAGGVGVEPVSASALRVEEQPVDPVADVDAPGEAAADEPSGEYDYLFGATQHPVFTVDDSSPPDLATEQPELDVDAGATGNWHTGLSSYDQITESPAARESDEASEVLGSVNGIIDGLPWETQAPLPAVDASSSDEALTSEAQQGDAPDTDPTDERGVDATVDRASLLAADAPQQSLPPIGPTVIAGYCPSRHLSPLHAERCRVCGLAMPEQSGFEVSRPTLGALRLATGDVVTLDRDVVLGRAPEIATNEAERPHLVRVASPANDVSRTHARIELDGWHIYLTDLGSVNGTVVTLPGREPERLRPHDPILLERGAVVVLADEVSLTLEVDG